MEIRIANECDINDWMNLVCKVKDSFPGLETKAALDGHRDTVLDFIYKESAQRDHCYDLSGRRAGGSRSKSLLSKAWLYSGADDRGVREQSAGVRNGSSEMANILTVSRIVLSFPLLCLPAFSVPFAVLYVIAGLTDMLDGVMARKTGTVSKAGAKLDTAADFVFTVVCLMKLLPIIELPSYLLIWTAVIAAIKLANSISGFVVQRKFVAVHSILNKFTGLLLFLFPLTLPFLDVTYSGSIVCAVAALAAIQEG